MFSLALWAYRTLVKIIIDFTSFKIFYGVEETLPIECEIPSLNLAIEIFPNTSANE
jgi:hypothetical protein